MTGTDLLAAASISPQVLVSQALGTTEAAIYTAAAGTSVRVTHGVVCNATSLTPAPTLTKGTTSTTGGTLPAGTYYWKVTARSAAGETLGSNEITATTTGSTSSQPMSWTAVPGAASYNVYRGTSSNGQNILVTNTTSLSYLETGVAGAAQTPPPASTYGYPAVIYLSILKAGQTLDGTHRIVNAYTLSANNSLALERYIGNAMLGPGDFVAGYASVAGAVDIVLSGTVHG